MITVGFPTWMETSKGNQVSSILPRTFCRFVLHDCSDYVHKANNVVCIQNIWTGDNLIKLRECSLIVQHKFRRDYSQI